MSFLLIFVTSCIALAPYFLLCLFFPRLSCLILYPSLIILSPSPIICAVLLGRCFILFLTSISSPFLPYLISFPIPYPLLPLSLLYFSTPPVSLPSLVRIFSLLCYLLSLISDLFFHFTFHCSFSSLSLLSFFLILPSLCSLFFSFLCL